MKRLLAFVLLSVIWLPVWAKNMQSLHPAINLVAMESQVTSERRGDELYMTVTVYPSQGRPSHYKVPSHPMYWSSEHLDQINNLKLWDGDIKQGEAVTLVLSLIEMDVPPWNTDDLVGTVRVHMRNNAGRLESSWSMPNRVDDPAVASGTNGTVKTFQLTGEGSNYRISLGLVNG